MKHRSLLFLTALFATLGAGAQNYFEAGGVTYEAFPGDTYATAVSYAQGDVGELRIPASVAYGGMTYAVQGINFTCSGDQALTSAVIEAPIGSLQDGFFSGCTALRSADISALPLSYVPNNLFSECTALTAVSLPESAVGIGDYAFSGCTALEEFTVPAAVTSMGSGLFSGCTSLSRLIFADSKEPALAFPYDFFAELGSLQSLYVGRNLEVDYNGVFSNAARLTKATFGGEATYVPGRIFWQAPALEEVEIGGKVDSIGWAAFADCPKLASATLPEGLRVVDYDAFYNDSLLAQIALPAGLQVLGSGAFYGCSRIEELTVPAGIRRLPDNLFSGCTRLRSLSLPEGLEALGSGTFSDCASLTEVPIPEAIRELPESVFYGCSGLDSIAIPENIEVIGRHAFGSCSGLQAVSFGAQVDTIRDGAFYECGALQRFYYGGTMGDWCRTFIEAGSYQEDTNPLTYAREWYMPDESGEGYGLVEHLVIPESVDSIRSLAFYGFRGAKSLSVPDTVEYIGGEAFGSCLYLEKARIGARFVDELAFLGCLRLDSVTLGPGVRSFGERAFYYCDKISDVFFEGELKDWFFISFADGSANPLSGAARFYVQGELVEDLAVPQYIIDVPDYAFCGYEGLKTLTLHPQVRSIGNSAFKDCTKLQAVSAKSAAAFPKKSLDFSREAQGLSVGSYAFSGCALLGTLNFGQDIASVGAGAFDRTLWYANQPDGVVYIGTSAYKYKGAMAEGAVVSIEEGTTQLCDEAFAATFGQPWLGGVVLPQSLRSIGSGAFSGCAGLAEISIPSGVEKIGSSAFSGCTGLKKVLLPEGLAEVESGLFADCSALEELAVPASVQRFYVSALGGMTGLKRLVIEDAPDTMALLNTSYTDLSAIPMEYAYMGRNLTAYSPYGASYLPINVPLWQNSPSLKEAVVGPQVTEIPDMLFSGCTALEKITSLAQNPPLCLRYDEVGEYYNFYGVDAAKCVLHVPSGTQQAYAAAGGWSYFFRMEEDPAVGIGTIEADGSEAGAEHFDARGLPVDAGAKGLHIIRYPDGRTEKRWVD